VEGEAAPAGGLAVAADARAVLPGRGGGELLKISFTQGTAPAGTQQPQGQTAAQGQSATVSGTAGARRRRRRR